MLAKIEWVRHSYPVEGVNITTFLGGNISNHENAHDQIDQIFFQEDSSQRYVQI